MKAFPNVLVQALACGCKVISSDCASGPREILQDGKWGRLFSVGDSEELFLMMQEALDDIRDTKTKQRALFFSVEKCLEKYEMLLKLKLMTRVFHIITGLEAGGAETVLYRANQE